MFSSSSSKPVRVGIELEVVFKSQPGELNYGPDVGNLLLLKNPFLTHFWSAVYDGSITDHGCEFVMTKPRPFNEYLEAEVYQLLIALNGTNRLIVSPLCGTHIHIDGTDLTKRQLVVFILLAITMQHILFGICPPHRRFNNFISTIEPNHVFASQITQVLSAINQGVIHPHELPIPSNQFKYSGINIWSLTKNGRGSVEFRMFPSTDNPEDIIFWIELLTRIKQYAMNIKGPGALYVKMQSGIKPVKFVESIIGPDLYHRVVSIMKPKPFKAAAEQGFLDGVVLCHLINNNLRTD